MLLLRTRRYGHPDRTAGWIDRSRLHVAFCVTAHACLIAVSASAQLVTNVTQIPRSESKPPVVFLNGYQSGCGGDSSFASTFGRADQVVQRDGRVSLFFNNCEQARNAPIEELGNAFRRYLDTFRFTDGQPVSEVDVIAHSLGGLIVRSYLSGKQTQRGLFQPPAETRIRKAVFLAVPNYGSIIATLATNPDTQTREMLPGSAFLFDLATWNQGIDDLRGVDTMAVVGNAGTGAIAPLERGFDDSTVALTSGSIEWTQPGKTRVVNYCHTSLSGLQALACSPNTSIAAWNGDQHEAARIAVSFLNNTSAWQSIGRNVTDVTTKGGVFVQLRDSNDAAVALVALNEGTPVQIRDGEIAWNDRLESGAVNITLGLKDGSRATVQTTVAKSATNAIIAKTGGPSIAAIFPSAAAVTPRGVAPGMFASIYGTNLAPSAEQAQRLPYPTTLANTQVLAGSTPLPLHYASAAQINAVIPETASGLLQMTVRNGSGQQTVNVLAEPAVPTLFAGAVTNAVTGALITPAAPAQRGDFIAIYLTGLGATERRGDLDWARITPVVTVGGQPCVVSYAGRAPGYVGLDQINCQIAVDAGTGNEAAVIVTSGRRTGTGTVALR
jgi:uncharacterized protein (TIGR03437 family)